MVRNPRPGTGRGEADRARSAPAYRPRLRRALALALVGAIGVATPALASGELDDIRAALAGKSRHGLPALPAASLATPQNLEADDEPAARSGVKIDLDHDPAPLAPPSSYGLGLP